MVNWVEACEHTNGAVGLWNSIRKIVQEAKQQEYEFILICEDDHFFTEHYTPEYLFSNIFHARQQGAYYWMVESGDLVPLCQSLLIAIGLIGFGVHNLLSSTGHFSTIY